MAAEILAAGNGARAVTAGGGSFSRNVSALLEHVEYRRCQSGEDLEALYRLRYKAYEQNGFIPASDDQMMTDELDETSNCYRYGVFIDNALVSTVRLHHVTREQPYGPIMSVFGDLLQPRLERGESFINPTLLAADPDCLSTHKALPYLTLRLAVIANTYFSSTNCVCVIRHEHAAFYQRIFGAEQVGEPRAYPPFTVPVLLYDSACSVNMERTLQRFPFFHSTAIERRMLFQQPEHGELAPLTILPTAKYFRDAA
jgi:hypothetical protein